MKKTVINSSVLLGLMLIVFACQQEDYTPYPRPWGFHRIDFPETQYKSYQSSSCPFEFEYPAEGEISMESQDSCWVDVYFPAYDCKWHITYRNTKSSKESRSSYFEDHYGMIYKHSKKATQIQRSPIQSSSSYGTFYEVYGNVGTPAQFFISDSTDEHVVMTSFYFNTALKNDSLAPVIDYMKGKMKYMVASLEWK